MAQHIWKHLVHSWLLLKRTNNRGASENRGGGLDWGEDGDDAIVCSDKGFGMEGENLGIAPCNSGQVTAVLEEQKWGQGGLEV